MIEIHKVVDFEDGAKQAALAIVDALMHCCPDAVLLLFSGGSPLEIIQYLPKELCDDRITVGVSDERYSEDPLVNNFAQVSSKITFKHSIDTRPLPGETLEQLGVRFDDSLKRWRNTNSNGKIIITQGIGLDGHTVGMIGRTFDEPNVWAIGYDAKEKNKYPLRVTTTVPFLTQQVDMSILFVCGADKQKPLTDVLSSQNMISDVPGRVIHRMKHCLLYTDCSVDRVNI